MPGDLRDPEASPWAGHHEELFNRGDIPYLGPLDLNNIIQAAARSILGHPLSKDGIRDVLNDLKIKKLDFRTPGDQEVQEAVKNYIQIKYKSRKVASKWLTLIDNL